MKYILTVLKHKWFVFVVGLKLDCSIYDLIFHDISKFSSEEFVAYNNRFFGKNNDPEGFTHALNHHFKRNKHHPEYWIYYTSHPSDFEDCVLEMPLRYVREMVADWLAACRTHEGYWPKSRKEWEWYDTRFKSMKIHELTEFKVQEVLSHYFNQL